MNVQWTKRKRVFSMYSINGMNILELNFMIYFISFIYLYALYVRSNGDINFHLPNSILLYIFSLLHS